MSLIASLDDAERHPEQNWGVDSVEETESEPHSPEKDTVFQFVSSDGEDDDKQNTSVTYISQSDEECEVTDRRSPTAVSIVSKRIRNPEEYSSKKDSFKIPKKSDKGRNCSNSSKQCVQRKRDLGTRGSSLDQYFQPGKKEKSSQEKTQRECQITNIRTGRGSQRSDTRKDKRDPVPNRIENYGQKDLLSYALPEDEPLYGTNDHGETNIFIFEGQTDTTLPHTYVPAAGETVVTFHCTPDMTGYMGSEADMSQSPHIVVQLCPEGTEDNSGSFENIQWRNPYDIVNEATWTTSVDDEEDGSNEDNSDSPNTQDAVRQGGHESIEFVDESNVQDIQKRCKETKRVSRKNHTLHKFSKKTSISLENGAKAWTRRKQASEDAESRRDVFEDAFDNQKDSEDSEHCQEEGIRNGDDKAGLKSCRKCKEELTEFGDCSNCSSIQDMKKSTPASNFYGKSQGTVQRSKSVVKMMKSNGGAGISALKLQKSKKPENRNSSTSKSGSNTRVTRQASHKKKDGSAENPVELLSSSDEETEDNPAQYSTPVKDITPQEEAMEEAQKEEAKACKIANRMKLPKGKKPSLTPEKKKKDLSNKPELSETTLEFSVGLVRVGTAHVSAADTMKVSDSDISLNVKSDDNTIKLRIEKDELESFVICTKPMCPIIALEVNQKCALRLNEKFPAQRVLDPGSNDEKEKRIIMTMSQVTSEQVENDLREMIGEIWKKKENLHFLSAEQAEKILSCAAWSLESWSSQDKDNASCKTSADATSDSVVSESATARRGYNTRFRSSSVKDNANLAEILLVFPPPPTQGGVTITVGDIQCLAEGEYLNDVIIDFYLKYLKEKLLSDTDKGRTHIFSSFFYKRLTMKEKSNASTQSVPLEERMHARVSSWTKNVDIFSKDFLIVPIVENSHWYLVVICFPGLEKPVPLEHVEENIVEAANATTETSSQESSDDDDFEELQTLAAGARLQSTKSRRKQDSSNNYLNSLLTSDRNCGESEEEAAMDTDAAENEEKKTLNEQESTEDTQDVEMEDVNRTETPSEDVEMAEATDDDVSGTATKDTQQNDKEPAQTKSSKKIKAKRKGGRISDYIKPVKRFKAQPCILVFDSLGSKTRPTMLRNLRGYLTVEWKSRRSKEEPRVFDKENIKANFPVVPQQDNYCDCGVFILQYVESFFQNPFEEFTLPITKPKWFELSVITKKRQNITDLIHSLKKEVKESTS